MWKVGKRGGRRKQRREMEHERAHGGEGEGKGRHQGKRLRDGIRQVEGGEGKRFGKIRARG